MSYFIISCFLTLGGSVLIFDCSEKRRFELSFIGLMLCIFGMACLVQSNPQAIDVYRGRTTLEITYKDSIPVDSVVVFKE